MNKLKNSKHTSAFVLLGLMLILPFVIQSGYVLRIINIMMIYCIIAVSINLVGGFGGHLAMGHACYVGIGAYTTAILTTRLGLPFLLTFGLSILFAAFYGLVTGVLCLCRIKGDYVMIVTMGISEITRIFFMNAAGLTGGPMGIPQVPGITLFGYAFSSSRDYYFLFLFLLVFTIIVIDRIVKSKFGRAIVAIREDEIAAKAMGIEINRNKVITFAVSTVFAGMAGALMAHYNKFVGPMQFNLDEGLLYYQMIIIGGLGSIPGSILGAVILVLVPEVFRGINEYRTIVYGLIMVIMMIVRPQGILGGDLSSHRLVRAGNALKKRFSRKEEIEKEGDL